MTSREKRFVRVVEFIGLLTLVVAFIRTAILPSPDWMIAGLWVGGVALVLVALVLSRLQRERIAKSSTSS